MTAQTPTLDDLQSVQVEDQTTLQLASDQFRTSANWARGLSVLSLAAPMITASLGVTPVIGAVVGAVTLGITASQALGMKTELRTQKSSHFLNESIRKISNINLKLEGQLKTDLMSENDSRFGNKMLRNHVAASTILTPLAAVAATAIPGVNVAAALSIGLVPAVLGVMRYLGQTSDELTAPELEKEATLYRPTMIDGKAYLTTDGKPHEFAAAHQAMRAQAETATAPAESETAQPAQSDAAESQIASTATAELNAQPTMAEMPIDKVDPLKPAPDYTFYADMLQAAIDDAQPAETTPKAVAQEAAPEIAEAAEEAPQAVEEAVTEDNADSAEAAADVTATEEAKPKQSAEQTLAMLRQQLLNNPGTMTSLLTGKPFQRPNTQKAEAFAQKATDDLTVTPTEAGKGKVSEAALNVGGKAAMQAGDFPVERPAANNADVSNNQTKRAKVTPIASMRN